jgi:hypothetical protein
MDEKPDIPLTPQERAFLEPYAMQFVIAERAYKAAVGALAVAKGATGNWTLLDDRSGFLNGAAS